MASLAMLLVSVLCLAVLGLAAYGARVSATACASRLHACERRERGLLEGVRTLLDASRKSSAAVLGALDDSLRALDSGADAVLFFAPAAGELVCIHATGARAEHFVGLRLHRDDARRLPVKAANAGCRANAPSGGDALLPNDRAALAVPMLDARGLRGVVYVSSADGHAFDGDAIVRAIEFASAPYAIALEREADRADATYDGLTGALGPRAFRRYLHDEVNRAALAHDGVLSLWFVDTDRFKSVNDAFGHPAGDAVLQAMVALLQAHLVPDDVAARNGGDEFCALIRGAPKSLAVDRARAFCAAVRAHDFGIPIRITASVGVATFPQDASSSSALLEVADAAMYHSKRGGRDRVSFAIEPGCYAAVV
jgi:diguanylate cyclase (GGDEF)-like protein